MCVNKRGKWKINGKLILGMIICINVLILGVYATETFISSDNISYDNSISGLSSTNLKGAIDELYEKSDIRNLGNFVSAYSYNESTCITGEEKTCIKTDCYKNKTANSCKAGDIIKYKVNDSDIVTFHVMFDRGDYLILQSQRNVIYNIAWINKTDYIDSGGSDSDYNLNGNNDHGPITLLNLLDVVTKGWSNVETQKYTMGETVFSTNPYTGCSEGGCFSYSYLLGEKTAKARAITYQEAVELGCVANDTCPKWFISVPEPYHTISASSDDSARAWRISMGGYLVVAYNEYNFVNNLNDGARAVVVVNK